MSVAPGRSDAPAGARPAVPAHSAVVQRKVGFEFETAVSIATTPSGHAVPYGVQVLTSKNAGWKIESDNSKVEFATSPVDHDNGGRLKVGKVMDEVTSWAKAMCTATQTAAPARTAKLAAAASLLGDAKRYKNEDIVLHTAALAEGDVTAAPQVTGGVTLDKIPQLIDQLVASRLEHLRPARPSSPSSGDRA